MTETKEEIYARNNKYRRKKAREYARIHKEEMSSYHKEWRRRKFLEKFNS